MGNNYRFNVDHRKYFNSNIDFINVMKVSKKNNRLTLMYHFNPIEDCSLFKNMETQHLFKQREKKTKFRTFSELLKRKNRKYNEKGMYNYVFGLMMMK